MKNSPLKSALAIFGIAVAIFLSCSDGPILVFPGKDEPIAPPSSSGEASSSSAESSSSEEADSSSSSGEADGSSSSGEAGDSSSSGEAEGSSSSGEEASSSSQCAEADKCGGECYNKETHFCYNKKEIHYRCGNSSYNVASQICCGSDLYPMSSYACCGGAGYLLSGYGCRNDKVLTKCGADLYDPLKEFCASRGTVEDLCDGRQFDPPAEYCDEVGGKDVIKGECGDNASLNYDTHFCYDAKPYELCGKRSYNPTVQFCFGAAIYDLCGGKDYNPSTEYCHTDGKPYSCGDKPYNPSAQFCSGTAIYSKCGGENYSPSTQFCSGVTVHDKCGGTIEFTPQIEQCCGSSKYTLATHSCYNNETYSCGNKPYNPSTHYCYNNQTYSCGNKPYNPSTHYCYNNQTYSCGNVPYNPSTQFCYNESNKVGDFCGINPQRYYNPDLYGCKTGSNGIYLKAGITDSRDSKTYDAVLIGTQVWMAENLNYETDGGKCYGEYEQTLLNGGPITLSFTEIQVNCSKYGRLYNWATAMNIDQSYNNAIYNNNNVSTRYYGICPSGWHIPSRSEWNILMKFVNPSCSDNNTCEDAGTKLKATSGWKPYSELPAGTDDYGFSALPGGSQTFFNGTSSGMFYYQNNYSGYWLSSSPQTYSTLAPYNKMEYNHTRVYRTGDGQKSDLYSVRCVKD